MPESKPNEFEIDGIIYGTSVITDEDWAECVVIEPFDDSEIEFEIKSEGWRKYADVLDDKQIAWLFQNLQYLSRGTADFLLRRSKNLTPEQIEWLKDHPDRDGAGDED